jgi:16S rRNA A1518/A1519 N6-dimethyltransferase RsmA/KsgA/DIM1 with predicted DNA glycosylase/AP lyase activity
LQRYFICMIADDVQRIVAKENHPDRCRLSALVQHYFEAELCTIVPSTSFTPRPKVDAGVVRLVKKASFAIPYGALQPIVQKIFSAPRKMLSSCLQGHSSDMNNFPANISLCARPSALTNDQITELSRWFLLQEKTNKIDCA